MSSTVVKANLGPILAGSHVNPSSSAAQGPYNISSGANVEIKSTQAITFEPGFETQPGAVMLAHIESYSATSSCTQWPSTNSYKTGSSELSGLSSGMPPTPINAVNIYPNPFTDDIQIAFGINRDRTLVNIIVTDLTGRIVYQKDGIFDKGDQNVSVTLNSSASIYIAKVNIGNNYNTQKLVKYVSY